MKTLKRFAVLLIVFLMLFCPANIYASVPAIDGYENMSVYVLDLKTGCSVGQVGNKSDRVYPASITKLLTTLVMLDYVSALDSSVTVGAEIDWLPPDSSAADLVENETISYKDLMYALLLPSGNDAAIVIAVNVGRIIGSGQSLTDSEAYDIFIEAMNKKAQALGMVNSSFKNPHGFHDENHYTTLGDLIILGKSAYANETIRNIVKTKSYSCTTNITTHEWINVIGQLHEISPTTKEPNLYYNKRVVGLKTGYTESAGNCFLFYAVEGDKEFIGAVMKAPNRETLYKASNALIDYAFDKNDYFNLYEKRQEISQIEITNAFFQKKNLIDGYIKKVVPVYMEKGETDKVTQSFAPNKKIFKTDKEGNYSLLSNIKAGAYLGQMHLSVEGKDLGVVALYSSDKIVIKGFKNFIFGYSGIIITGICILILALVIFLTLKNNTVKISRSRRNGAKKYKVRLKKKRKRSVES